MKNFKKLLLLCFLFLCGLKGNAQITTGDIAIIGFNGVNNPAELAIVTLSAISSGQTIYITDRGWHPTAGFATANTTAEGLLAWTITTEIPAGTILKASITAGSTASVTGLSAYGTTTLTGWSGLVTAQGGDNWFIYTGSEPSPTFVYAFANWATNTPGGEASATPWQDTGDVNSTTSYLPPILAAGNFSAAFTGSTLHGDYINYTGSMIGTKDQILANLAETDNWVQDETTPADLEPGGADFPGTNPIFQLPPSPPSTPVLAATSDKGFLDNDQITNITTPIITGTAKAGTTVTLYDTDGTTVLGAAIATGGNWSITSSTLSSGTHTLTAKATDAGNNTSAASTGLAITIDTTAPTLAITSNVSALKIGETASITFTFSEDPSTTFNWDGTNGDVVVTGGTLTAISGSGLTRTATFTPTANGTGTASITVAPGTYTDVAGNNGEGGATPALSFDTEAPAAPSTPVLAAASDKGFSTTDQITNINSPEITGTAETGATVTLYDTDGTTLLGTVVATTGSWSIISAALSQGTHTLTAKATDVAGNTGPASAGSVISIDITAPTVAITSNVSTLKIGETASITFTFSEDPSTTFNWSGTTGNVAVTGGYLSAISGSGLTRSATFTPKANATGTASITVGGGTYTDVAGNNGEAGTTPALSFDTQAPAAPATLMLAAASDNGFSNADNITNATTPKITGTAEAGATVTLYDTDGTTVLGTTVATNGVWLITSATLSSGTHTLTATATDVAGNTGAASAGLSITIDTTSPTLAITSNVSTLKSDETASITFTFSEDPSTTFDLNDVTVTGGTLAAISGSGLTRTATFTPTANAAGTASITVAAATYTDVAGNNGGAGTTPILSFDTEAPAAPATLMLATLSDSGVSNADNITNVTTPAITGTAEPGTTVTLYDTDGTTVLGTSLATAGNWSITSTALSEGTHTLTAKATDVAGNTGAASAGLSITIDTTSPTLAITSNVSTLKSGETASITFTFSEDPSTTFNLADLTVTGGTLAAISGSGLTYTGTFSPAANATGIASITVAAATYTDVAGNNGGAGTTPALSFDTEAPTAPTTPVLATASDKGFSDTDQITNVTTPEITGTAEAGATVTLYDTDGTTVIGTSLATGGNWSITSSTLISGAHTLTAKATDVAGNTGPASAGLAITIDTTAPTMTITSNVSALKIGETASITFTFSEDPSATFNWDGTNGDITVTGGTLAAISGSGLTRTAIFTPTANATGTASITVTAGTYTDVAGNNGGAGTTPALSFDTEAPAAPTTPILAALSDKGFSDTDQITNVTTPTITGTAEAGATVTLYDTDGTTVLGTSLATGGNWSITSTTLSLGTHTLTAKATDVAGNTGAASAGLTITIDTTAPALAITSNVSTLKLDETASITFTFSEDPSTTFEWDGTNGDVVVTGGTLTAISGSGLTRTATFTPTANATGIASITVAAGTYTDVAGNNGGAGTTPILSFDTEAPDAPATPVLAAASDSGVSNADNITKVTTPAITGTAEPGTTVTLYDTDGTTVLGTSLATAGNWSITSTALSEGTHTLTAKATDVAGNTGAASAGLSITIDTTAPTLAITSNVSTLKSGETASITFTFSEDPSTTFNLADLTVTGGTLAAISGSGLTYTGTFSPTANATGIASITVAAGTYTDVAGNNGGAGTTPALSFDTQAPAAPAKPVLAATSDKGFSDTDQITNVTNPEITGTAETGATVTLYDTDGTTVLGTAIATGGNWSITSSTLLPGAHTLTAKATDVAGNTGSASAGLAITIDTTSPTLAITSNVSTLKTGETASITFTFSEDPSTTFEWDGTNGDVVVTGGTLTAISGSGLTRTATFSPTANATGTASITVAASTYTDVAGNSGGAGTTPTLTFDTEAPAAPTTPILAATSDKGFSDTDQITNVTTPTITGTAEAGATVTLYDTDGTTVLGTAVATGGNWSITSTTLSSGTHTLTAQATDVAGNTGAASAGLTITIDTTAPALAITSNVPILKSGETASITFTFSEDPSTTFEWDGTNGDVTITGGTLTAISGSGLTRTATFSPTANATGTASITVAAGTYTDVAGNNGGAGTTPALSFDTEAATLAAVNLVSNNPIVTLAKVGDAAKLTFTSSETLQTPEVEISGHQVVPIAAGNNWTANYIFTNTDTEGPVTYKITFKDLAGNDGIPVSTGNGAITFDRTAPAVPAGLAATPGDMQIDLNWVANTESDLAMYRILYGTSTNPSLLLTEIPVGTTNYTHTGLSNGTTYYYVIQAMDKAGNIGAVSSDVTAVPKANQTIIFDAITAKTYGDASFQLGDVNSSAGLPLTYTAEDPAVISITGNIATILKAGNTMITASQAGNTSFNAAISVQQNLSVNTKELIVTTVSRDKVYGDLLTESDFTGSISGLVTGDGITATRNSTGAGVTATVNTYPILATLVDPNHKLSNYAVNNTAGVLTVTKKALTIAATAQNKTYGDAFNFAGTEFTSSGLTNGNTITSLSLSSPGAVTTATVLGSPYSIVPSAATGAGLDNYAITYTNSILTVDRKAMTITAEDKEKFEGTANPELTVSYSAFANGETNLVFTTQPNITTTAATNSPIGDYPITAAGAAAANYSFSYVPGQLTIKPGAPTSITFAGVTLYENSATGTNAGTLNSTSDAPGATYTFTLVPGTGDTDNSLFVIAGNKINTASVLDFESKATYSLRVKSTTQYGLSLEKVITIDLSNVNEIPTLAAIGNQTICFTTAAQNVSLTGITAGPDAGQTTTLSVSSSNPGLFGSLNVTGTGTTGKLSYRIKAGTKAGTATVTVTVKDDGGTANGGVDTYSRTFVITVNALPVVAINSNKGTQISKGDQVLLSATGGTSYVWAAHGSIIGGLNSATIEVRPRETTTYTVTATNASGCSESKTFTLTVLEDFQKIKATNILSPNNDGYNDKWIVDNIDFYPNNEVKVFDKAGRLVYGKKGYDNSWEGTFNGTPLAEGTYYYIIDFGTRQRVFKGFITIVKND